MAILSNEAMYEETSDLMVSKRAAARGLSLTSTVKSQ